MIVIDHDGYTIGAVGVLVQHVTWVVFCRRCGRKFRGGMCVNEVNLQFALDVSPGRI